MNCPECGSESVQTVGKRNWPYPVALLAIIPTAFAVLHQAASPIDYRCPSCGLLFARRTPTARFALLVMVSFIAMIVLLLAAATLLTSCVGSTEPQVLERANREAKAAGYDLRHYRASAHYNFREANDTWVVFYEGIGDARGYGTVGDHFTVYVPNRGGEVELMPGR